MLLRRFLLVALALLMLPAARALATVSLTISDNDATPTSVNVAPGGSFNFTVRLISTTEQTTGLDYYLLSSDSTGLLSIGDRNTAGSDYADPLFFTDTTVESSPSNLLNPRNDNDLGGLATTTQNPGTHLVASYTINVSPITPLGSYTIQTTSNPNEGWIDTMSNEFPFDQHGSFTVNVPEPAGLAVVTIALAGLLRRRH